jgi:hypothetical protein
LPPRSRPIKENDAHGKKEMKARKLIGADLIDPEHKRRGMAALVKREHEYAKRAMEYGAATIPSSPPASSLRASEP